MKVRSKLVGFVLVLLVVLTAYSVPAQKKPTGEPRAVVPEIDAGIDKHARQMLETGRRIFRFDTFGSEAFWGETLQLHQAITGEERGSAVE
jgi:hypothetical protein